MLKVFRFTADWCGPCKVMAPTIEKLAKEYSDPESGVEIISINVDENRELAEQYSIRSIPTLVFEKAGKEVDRTLGAKQYSEIHERIQNYK